MNLPNKLTVSRIILTFLMMGFLFGHGFAAKLTAFFIFLLACVTDFLDGRIARKRHEISDFGKIMDPIADKVLILGALLAFVEMGLIPAWMVIVIIIREFSITGLRFFAIKKGTVLAAESAGKHKTISQMVTVFFILFFLVIHESVAYLSFWNQRLENGFKAGIFLLMTITVALTIVSGLSFIWQNRKLVRSL